MKRRLLLALLSTLPLALSAATEKPRPWVLSGRVVNTEGKPVAGARILLDSTLLYNSNTFVRTGRDGRYRIDIPRMYASPWHAYAEMETTYHGRRYRFDLHPENPDDFVGQTGAIRNFRWTLTGEKTGRLYGRYGGSLYIDPEVMSNIDRSDVEVTLTPDGPLIDGSKGQVLRRRVGSGGGEFHEVPDLPIGRYKITARLVSANRPLVLKLRSGGNYVRELTIDFEPEGGAPSHCKNCVQLLMNYPQ
ncbi:hypothetical protein HNR42_000896 [Deinobacterium chartae]|uniref:Carboxypeptidase regulatory-like domain-containing protein n=1 Tax=Deinobacterium chartae TaxID=521158 RepID=A0A841HZ37_9DEIO|nr:carboxypeptidase-like regulatory domain-containing protein [Deinobacterium chartae]MBB6097479.1 hypothetical protein [Deinobacterium chartae]